MNRHDIAAVLEKIQADAGLKDPATVLLVSRVLVDFSALQVRAAAGEDVTSELAVIAATTANLDENVRKVVTLNFQTWLQNLLAQALGVALLGV